MEEKYLVINHYLIDFQNFLNFLGMVRKFGVFETSLFMRWTQEFFMVQLRSTREWCTGGACANFVKRANMLQRVSIESMKAYIFPPKNFDFRKIFNDLLPLQKLLNGIWFLHKFLAESLEILRICIYSGRGCGARIRWILSK